MNPHLGQFGTFDVENYGDLLYPVIFQKMLNLRSKNAQVTKFSLRGSSNLQDNGYDSRAVRSLFSRGQEEPHTLVVGGGDLLRTDWLRVASHYKSICAEEGESLRPRGIRRRILRWRKLPVDEENEFRRRYMNYPAAGPFIIAPGHGSKIPAVAYCSCGVPFRFEEVERAQIADIFNRASFIYLRDKQSRDTLRAAGVTRDILVAPDLIVATSDLFDAAAEREKGRKILAERGLDVSRKTVVFHCNVQSPERSQIIFEQLQSFQKRTGFEIALLPLAKCHNDGGHLRELATRSGGAFKHVELDSIFEMISVLAAADIFFGTSMHGNITAFSFGIPHVFGPIDVAKRDGFLEMVNLPPDVKCESWDQMNAALDIAIARDNTFFQSRAITAKQLVHDAFDSLLKTLDLKL